LLTKLGGAAAAGVGLAAGGATFRASPAAAAGTYVALGNGIFDSSNATAKTTDITCTGAGEYTLRLDNTGTTSALRAQSVGTRAIDSFSTHPQGAGVYGLGHKAGIEGHTDAAGGVGVLGDGGALGPGVKGLQSSDQPAVHGDNSATTGTGGAGVLGTSKTFQGVAGVSEGDVGVIGLSNAAPSALSPIGVLGIAKGTGVEARGEVVGLRAQGPVQVHLVPGSTAGAPTAGNHSKGEVYADSAGVMWLCIAIGAPGTWVRNVTSGENALGAGTTTMRTTGTGTALTSRIDNTTNALPALRGHTLGLGNAIYGTIANTANTAPAVRGQTDGTGVGVQGDSTSGRGGRFSGKAAAIQLVASTDATHPASGTAGDLFLDNVKRLWLCKGGTTWVDLTA
jgi:hypothetical protein